MPLPIGTPKTKYQLENQADTTYKDNGSTDLTRTRGVDVRQFIADLLASVDFGFDLIENTQYPPIIGVKLDKERHYFADTSSLTPVTDPTLKVTATDSINGGSAKLFSQATSTPAMNYTGFTQVFESFEPYDTTKINVYEFICIKVGTFTYLQAYRYVLNP